METNIVSVERILHQTEVQPEAPQEIPETKPSEPWPSAGQVELRNYSTRYRPELDLVLRNISLTIVRTLSCLMITDLLRLDLETEREDWSLRKVGIYSVMSVAWWDLPQLGLELENLRFFWPCSVS